MKKNFSYYSLALLFASIALFSCKKTDYLEIDAGDRPPLAALQRFINARADNSNLVFWNFTAKLTPQAIVPNAASGYVEGNFGSVQINVTEGANTSYLVSRLFGNSATFSSGGGPNGPIATYYHSIFAAKAKNGVNDSLLLFYDNLDAPASGKAKLRFINLAPGLGNVNVVHTNGSTTNVFSNVSYGNAGGSILSGEGLSAWSLGPFIEVEAGEGSAYELQTSSDQANITLSENKLSEHALESGKIYTVFITNIPGKTSEYGLHVIEHKELGE